MSHHLREIDGLRAVAVLAVVIYHFDKQYLPLGYLGVDIFFAISGYVISKSILDRAEAGLFTFKDFFMRRAKRLLPALAAMITVSVIVAALLMPGKMPLATGAAAFVGSSNILLWFANQDYFAFSAEWNPLTHTWSLGAEEQFYLIFPFLLLLVRGQRRVMFLLLGGVAIISLTSYIWMWYEHRASVFYLTPFRLWELMLGALVNITYRTWGCLLKTTHQSLLKSGLLFALLIVLFSDSLPEHFSTALCVFASCGVLYLSGRGSKPNPILLNPTSLFIGKISYSVYLWHWPVAVFSKLMLTTEWVLPAYIVLTTVLSLFSYYGIEEPLRFRKWTWFQNNVFIAFPSFVVVAALVIAGVWFAKPLLYLGPKQMLESQFLRSDPCHIPNENGLSSCLKENAGGGNTIWLVGDSHAGNFAVSLESAAKSLGVNFQHLTSRSLFASLSNNCTPFLCPEGGALDLAGRLRAVSMHGDVLVIGFARDRFEREAEENEIFRRNLKTFVDELNASRLNVVLVEDIPKVCINDSDYLKSSIQRQVCTVSAVESRAKRSVLSAIYKSIQEEQTLTILDPHDRLCEQADSGLMCRNWFGSELLYLDSSPHLTYWASSSLSVFFVDKLKPFFATK